CLDQHASDQCMSGYPIGPRGNQDGHPSLGSAVARLQGPVDKSVPPFVGLTIKTRHAPYSNPGLPGFLGPAYAAFQPDGEGMQNMRLNGITLDRLRDRQGLLRSFDRFRRAVDSDPALAGAAAFTRTAFDVLTSSRLVEALDLEREDPAVRDRYGRGGPDPAFGEDAGPHWMDQFLMARRLVEAGVRCVTLSFGSWDRHHSNFARLPEQLARFDQGITALIEDLTTGGSTKTSALLRGASLVERRASTRMRAGIIGRRCRALCLRVVVCGPGRSSARPTAWAKCRTIDRSITRTSSRRSITAWES